MKLYNGKISKMGIGARGLDTPAERDFLKKTMAKKPKKKLTTAAKNIRKMGIGARGLDTPAQRAFIKKTMAKKKLKKSGPSGRK